MKNHRISFIFFIISYLNLSAQVTNKVLIIGIDGCRQDALITANTPNINTLIANGTYSFDALTEGPTWSGVGWSGMLTGVWRAKHGVSDNSFAGSRFDLYPHIYDIIEACDADKETASIVHWGPINSNILNIADYELIVGTDLAVRTNAVDYLSNNDPDILFLHFDDIDYAGHANGFAPNVSNYVEAIETTDSHIGHVLNAVYNRANYSNENWIIMVSTDHGGNASGHGGNSFEERNIFVVVSGDNMAQQEISKTTNEKNFDESLVFNGTDQFVNIPNNSNYNFGAFQDFTIECMVKVNNIDGDASIIGNKDWASGANKGFVFSYVFPDGPEWKVNIGDGTNRVDINGPSINDGNWHHLAVSFDRDGMMSLYHNGAFVEASDMSAIGDINTNLPISIGQDGRQSYSSWFDGNIAEVKIWSRVLDQTTISNYACSDFDSNHPYINQLIAYWPISEGSGSNILDISNFENNGIVNGSTPIWDNTSTSISCSNYNETPRIVDIAVTALDHLCGNIDPALNLDGESLITPIALAIEIQSFKGNTLKEGNAISWQITPLENVYQIQIERSINEQNDFKLIQSIEEDQLNSDYTFIDTDMIDQAYYRLKIKEHDETISYSKTIFLDRQSINPPRLIVSPNPVQSQIQLHLSNLTPDDYQIQIFNLQGQVIFKEKQTITQGETAITFSSNPLSSGLYFIQIHNAYHQIIQKFIKQ